jgi:hypothetical protein
MLQDSEINIQAINIEPYLLVDETSTTEYYIGTSRSFSDPGKPNWRIKRIIKIGNIWKSQYPNGDQRFQFIWDDRFSYIYS